MTDTLTHSDIATDRLARAANCVQATDIAHPDDTSGLRKVLDAIAVVQAALAAFAPTGWHLEDAVCVAVAHLDEAASALKAAGQADLSDLLEAV